MYPKEYISFLIEFHGTRDYFECHEILEEYWKETAPGERDSHWVGLIQLAVSLYHYRRGNTAGAAKTIRKAHDIFQAKAAEISGLGLDVQKLLASAEEIEHSIQNGLPYVSVNLPITDPSLISACGTACTEAGLKWGSPSNPADTFLVNRHLLRDRSEVIDERKRQLGLRHQKKPLT